VHAILHLVVLALTIFALSRFLPAVRIRSGTTAVLVAVVFSVLNFFLGWFLQALLFVPALLTFGLLFLFVPFIVNTVLLWLTDKLIASFEIRGLSGLLVSAGILTLVNGVFQEPLWHALCHSWGAGHHGRWV